MSRPELTMTRWTEYHLHHRELERLIEWKYEISIDVLTALAVPEGLGQNFEYTVTGKFDPENKAIARRLDNIREGGRERDVGMLLQALVADGELRPGVYVLHTGRRHHIAEKYARLLRDHRDWDHKECASFRDYYMTTSVADDIKSIDQTWDDRWNSVETTDDEAEYTGEFDGDVEGTDGAPRK